MNLALRCPKCGQWTNMNTKDVNEAYFKCYVCNARKKLKDWKGNWNMKWHPIPENIDASDLVAKLNEKYNEK